MEHIEVFDVIEQVIRSGAAPAAGMATVLAFCQAAVPEAAWARVQALPIESDVAHLERWLRQLLVTEPPPMEVDGLWFGLFEPLLENGTASLDMYVSGSDHYDATETEWHDWAVSPCYWPDARYANSIVLPGIRAATYAEPPLPYDLSDYALSLAYGGLFVSTFARNFPGLLLGSATTRALVIGHDAGDFITIGAVSSGGFKASDA